MSTYFDAMSRIRGEVPARPQSEPAPERPLPPRRSPVPSRPAVPDRVRRPQPSPVAQAELRESLLARSNGHQLRTVVFAGCEGGEGCTWVVGDLARLLADSGLYVLLVDADSRVRAAEPRTGWRHAQRIVEVTPIEPPTTRPVEVVDERLTIARSPTAVPDKERLFHGGEFARWLARQRETYDYVLIDGPPLLRFADSMVMGRESDGLVLVVAAGWTGKSSLVRAHRQLEHAQVNVIGAVLNRASDPIPSTLRQHFAFVRE